MVEFIKSKKEMSEEDIKANFITPAIVSKGWKNGEHIAYEEYFTDGRIEVRGDKARRKEGKKSDYSLYYQFGTRIAIVEAKDNKHSVRAGLQQAIEYGEILDVPFVYSSNGDGFIEHDRITREERELELDEFPTREELFSRMTVDIDHAERMRAALVKENLDLVQEDYRYVMQVTGDNAEGKAQLDNFMDVNSNFPAIVTTSKLLTTGVNAKTCRLIVLDSNIQSMTEFKQIIGRGTRLYPQKGKEFFTIIDFRNVTNLFADPDFDGDPVKVLETGAKTVSGSTPGFVDEEGDPVEKYIVTDKQVTILNSTVQVLDENGKLITESLTDYTRKNILGSYATLNDFITVWHTADKKKLILDELYKKGVYLDAIRESEGISEQKIDDFDLLLKLAYGQKELTKTERINKLKQSGYLYKYSEEARAVLEILLNKYMDKGIGELESIETLKLPEFQIYGGTFKIINTYFGDKKRYLQAIKELEQELFTVA